MTDGNRSVWTLLLDVSWWYDLEHGQSTKTIGHFSSQENAQAAFRLMMEAKEQADDAGVIHDLANEEAAKKFGYNRALGEQPTVETPPAPPLTDENHPLAPMARGLLRAQAVIDAKKKINDEYDLFLDREARRIRSELHPAVGEVERRFGFSLDDLQRFYVDEENLSIVESRLDP